MKPDIDPFTSGRGNAKQFSKHWGQFSCYFTTLFNTHAPVGQLYCNISLSPLSRGAAANKQLIFPIRYEVNCRLLTERCL